MFGRRRSWVAVVALALFAAACGSSSGQNAANSPSPRASATPQIHPAGQQFEATGFSTLVPRGWQNRTRHSQKVQGQQIKAAFVDQGAKGAIFVGERVLVSSLQSVISLVTREDRRFAISAVRPFTMAGQRGFYVRFSQKHNGTVERDQLAVFKRGDILFDLTAGAPVDLFPRLLPVLTAVEGAWRWNLPVELSKACVEDAQALQFTAVGSAADAVRQFTLASQHAINSATFDGDEGAMAGALAVEGMDPAYGIKELKAAGQTLLGYCHRRGIPNLR
jgi:hypothetical protein